MNLIDEEEYNSIMLRDMGEGAEKFEEYLAGPFKEEWHKAWKDGKTANEQGISIKDNPHRLKVFVAAWKYGWNDYNPIPDEFTQVESYLEILPTRQMTNEDI